MEEKYELKNCTLDILEVALRTFLLDNAEQLGELCSSEWFIGKVRINALNRLPAQYVTTKRGEVYTAFSQKENQNSANVLVAITRAAQEIMNNNQYI